MTSYPGNPSIKLVYYTVMSYPGIWISRKVPCDFFGLRGNWPRSVLVICPLMLIYWSLLSKDLMIWPIFQKTVSYRFPDLFSIINNFFIIIFWNGIFALEGDNLDEEGTKTKSHFTKQEKGIRDGSLKLWENMNKCWLKSFKVWKLLWLFCCVLWPENFSDGLDKMSASNYILQIILTPFLRQFFWIFTLSERSNLSLQADTYFVLISVNQFSTEKKCDLLTRRLPGFSLVKFHHLKPSHLPKNAFEFLWGK